MFIDRNEDSYGETCKFNCNELHARKMYCDDDRNDGRSVSIRIRFTVNIYLLKLKDKKNVTRLRARGLSMSTPSNGMN